MVPSRHLIGHSMRVHARSIWQSLAVASLVAPTTLVVAGAQTGPNDPVIVAVGDLACQSLTQGQGEGACRSGEIADLIRAIDPFLSSLP